MAGEATRACEVRRRLARSGTISRHARRRHRHLPPGRSRARPGCSRSSGNWSSPASRISTAARRSPWLDFRMVPDALERAAGQTHRRLPQDPPADRRRSSTRRKQSTSTSGATGATPTGAGTTTTPSFTPGGAARHQRASIRTSRRSAIPTPTSGLAFLEWLDRDAYPNWPFWSHIQGWFDARHLPNLKLVHFADLKADLRGEIEKIAAFLEIDVAPESLARDPRALQLRLHEDGRREAGACALRLQGGGKTFINKGTNGRWRDVLTADDIARYEAEVAKNLTPDAARWLATGELPA